MSHSDATLSPSELAIYEWQMWVRDLGVEGQRKLKNASVLVSRCGGLGGLAAYELAAAGVGKIVVAHAGNLKQSDLHRQLLQTADWVGKPRIESIVRRLRELNPHIEIVGVAENVSAGSGGAQDADAAKLLPDSPPFQGGAGGGLGVQPEHGHNPAVRPTLPQPLPKREGSSEGNAKRLIEQVDIVVDAAPLFEERYAMNDEAVRQGKPVVECAMYEMEGTVTTIIPGKGPCLRCLCPTPPSTWTRQFPVLGAVSGTVGCLGAVEVIKLITGIGEPLVGRMLKMDLRSMRFQVLKTFRDPKCPACANL